MATTERKTCMCPNLETSESDRTRKKEEQQNGSKTEGLTERKIHNCLEKHGVEREVAYLMNPDRALLPVLLKAHGMVDICIPRGSQALIDFVRENAAIPLSLIHI